MMKPVLVALGLTLVTSAYSQTTILTELNFDTLGSPWVDTGPVSFLNHVGTPTQITTGLVPTPGNVAAISLNGEYAYGTDLVGSVPGVLGIEMWIKNPGLTGASTSVVVASIGQPGVGGNGVSLIWNQGSPDRFTVLFGASGGGGYNITTGNFPDLDGWIDVAILLKFYPASSNTATVYFNGVSQGFVSAPFNSSVNANWRLFSNPDGLTTFTGLVDDVKLFYYPQNGFNVATDLAYYSAVPEPSTAALALGAAALGVVVSRTITARRKKAVAAV